MKKSDNAKNKFSFLGVRKVLPYLSNYRGIVIFMLGCGFASSMVDVLVPIYQKYALNHFIGERTLDTVFWFILIYAASIIFAGIVNYISCWLALKIEVSVNKDLRNAAFDHLQTLSFSYFNQNSVGYIHARVMSDTSRIGTLFSWTLMNFAWPIAYFIGSIIVMFSINVRLTLWVMSVVPIIVLSFSLFKKRLINVNREAREINSLITSDFNEGITGAKTVKSLVVGDYIEQNFLKDTHRMKNKIISSSHLHGLFVATMHMASSVVLAIVLWKGGIIAESDVGTFSVFMSYAQGLTGTVQGILNEVSNLITTQVNIERFVNLLNTRSDVQDTPEVIEKYGDSFEPKKENWEELNGDIEFKDVSFKYPDGDEYILENFNLKIPFGSNVAIVGETGAGKSTLVNLVCRFFEPTSGAVLIDGRDARERSQLWLHSSIGYVLQTPHLFSGTVRENLLYGNPNATEEDIDRAIKLVSADGVIANMEKGLESDVGEGGEMLSTGEKQLLSFARAILADPKILVLDEATASVDTITEQKIQSAIDTIIKGRTSIMIAHRLSTVKNADIILVVKNGKIIERGKHSELLTAKGHYYNLYTRQYQDEATESVLLR